MKSVEEENKELRGKILRAIEVLNLLEVAGKERRGLAFIIGIIKDAKEILEEDL